MASPPTFPSSFLPRTVGPIEYTQPKDCKHCTARTKFVGNSSFVLKRKRRKVEPEKQGDYSPDLEVGDRSPYPPSSDAYGVKLGPSGLATPSEFSDATGCIRPCQQLEELVLCFQRCLFVRLSTRQLPNE